MLFGCSAFIQRKGTIGCAGLFCRYGAQLRFDWDFVYHVRCQACNQHYRVGDVPLIPLDAPPATPIIREPALVR